MRKILNVFMVLMLVFAMAVPAQAATVKLNKKTVTVYVGKTTKLKVSGTKSKVKWSSSNKKVATVNNKGIVTGKKKGTATITATVNKKKYKCKVTVKKTVTKKVTAVKFSKYCTSIGTGSSYQFSVKVSPSNATNKKVKWTSSNSSIASVSSDGKVTGKKTGKVTIKATSTDGSKKSCSKTVTIFAANQVVDINTAAPKASNQVREAFKNAGLTVTLNSTLKTSGNNSWAGHFDLENGGIHLRVGSKSQVYHELGHFVSFVTNNSATKSEFASIYKSEKNNIRYSNHVYVTSTADEYFAESYATYVTAPNTLRLKSPKTFEYIKATVESVSATKAAMMVKFYTSFTPA